MKTIRVMGTSIYRDVPLKHERESHKNATQDIFDELIVPNGFSHAPWLWVKVDSIYFSYDGEADNGKELSGRETFEWENLEREHNERETSQTNLPELGRPVSVELSVLTQKIYDYDRETVLSEEADISIAEYRPYFVSIIVKLDDNDEANRKAYEFFKEMGNRWVEADLLSTNEIDKGDNVFNASLVCSASPFQIFNKKILIKTLSGKYFFNGIDINDLVKADYNTGIFALSFKTQKDIEDEITRSWRPSGYDYIDIYNVGHGNADYIVCGKKRILYDIGYQYKKYPNNSTTLFPKATWSFSNLKPGLVILSHWDSDHFMGCVYASDDIFNVNWIAPALTRNGDSTFSLNAFRLAAFLRATGKLMLVERKSDGSFAADTGSESDYRLMLRMGASTASETGNITYRNREGLYIEIYDEDQADTLLSGDVPYNSMCDDFFGKKSIKYLHVPHHCSQMMLDKLDRSKWSGTDQYAVISTDKKKNVSAYNEHAKHRKSLGTKFGTNVRYTIGALSRNVDEIRSIRLLKDGGPQERV